MARQSTTTLPLRRTSRGILYSSMRAPVDSAVGLIARNDGRLAAIGTRNEDLLLVAAYRFEMVVS